MIELIGTEKQIAWAKKLRSDFSKGYDLLINQIEGAKTIKPELYEQQKDNIDKIKQVYSEMMANKDKATYWIDNVANKKLPPETMAFFLIKEEGNIEGM